MTKHMHNYTLKVVFDPSPQIQILTTLLSIPTTVPLAIDQNLLPQYTKCLTAFQDPSHKLMFGHFLRSETGRGDTIDR